MLLPHELLRQNERDERRTITDALEVLWTQANFEEGDTAEIWLGPLRLPSTQIVSLICVTFNSDSHKKIFMVQLPTALTFRAKLDRAPEFQEFEIGRLGGASVNGEGQVRLSDGTHLRGVEVIPANLPYNITPVDWAVIRQTIAELGIEEECRYVPTDPALREIVPDLIDDPIDCSKLSGHPAPLLKVVQGRIQDHFGGTVSQQKIADTLRKFGMRVPTGRPSSRQAPAAK